MNVRAICRGPALACLLVFCLAVAEAGSAQLTVKPLDGPPIVLDVAALQDMPQISIEVKDEAGGAVAYAGVLLSDILSRSGVEFGRAVRGHRLSEYVIVAAADGYKALFALAELDAQFRTRIIALCHSRDGARLRDEEGPLRLIVADERRPARWVRQVISIEIGRVP